MIPPLLGLLLVYLIAGYLRHRTRYRRIEKLINRLKRQRTTENDSQLR